MAVSHDEHRKRIFSVVISVFYSSITNLMKKKIRRSGFSLPQNILKVTTFLPELQPKAQKLFSFYVVSVVLFATQRVR